MIKWVVIFWTIASAIWVLIYTMSDPKRERQRKVKQGTLDWLERMRRGGL